MIMVVLFEGKKENNKKLNTNNKINTNRYIGSNTETN